jgi:DNA-binding NtrC family response regulator
MRKKRVLLLDDDELIRMVLSRAIEEDGYEVRSESETKDIVNKIKSWFPDVLLLDVSLPGMNGIDILRELMGKGFEGQVVMLTADDSAETAVTAMKLGAADYLTKPFNLDEVKIVIRKVLEKLELEQEVENLRKISSDYFDRDIIGESASIRELKSKIERLAQARVPSILVTGESGTGKEVVVRNIHRMMSKGNDSGQRGPFVAVNCAALPEQLLESELFGSVKGAYTDSKIDKKGVFELAGGGTLLLDEIGEMNANLQSKLLRVLEERTVRRLGGKEDIPVDVMVIATTNRDIREAIKEGNFRNDLFFRLSTFYLYVPPLRERKEDIPLLARHFISLLGTRYNRKVVHGFSPEAEKILTGYSWPGNVRELKNLVERLVVLESEEFIRPHHLPHWLTGELSSPSGTMNDPFVLPEEGLSIEDLEKSLIVQALERTNHNQTQAAKLLKMTYFSLRYQMKRLGLQ